MIAIVAIAAYIAAQIFSDIASLKIVYILGMSVDAGTLIYPLTFTIRDVVHRAIGKKATRVLIVAAAAINLFMAGLFWLVSVLPPDMSVGPQQEFAILLAPVWRIVIASIVAEVASELIDTEVYSLWKKRFQEKHVIGRVYASNAAAIPVDSLLFVLIAFWGALPPAVVLSIFVANVLIKGILSLASAPLIYLSRG